MAAHELISRKEAMARGLTRYFHGRPCKHGHISQRDTGTHSCCECRIANYANNPANRERKRLAYWKEGGKEKRRALNLKAQYGLTIEQFNAMALSQDFCCAICDERSDLAGKRLVVDHDHATGKLRSLLCCRCNLGLGSFNDNRKRLARAIKYLLNHGKT